MPAVNKNYMSIAVSVQIWRYSARINFCAARQGSSPKSATAYSFETLQAILKLCANNEILLWEKFKCSIY